MTAQLQALRDQVDALQRRLDAQNAAERQTKATADQAAAQAASANTEAATATAAAQAIPAEVKMAIDAATPKTDRIYYKGVTLTLGGFGALESVYRTRNETADIASSFSGIPFNNVSAGQTSEFRFSARQSRITALAQGDVNPDTHLAFYGELDFLGAAQTANSNETNSYTPRMRVFYNQVDWDHSGLHLLAGQNWSLVTMQVKGLTLRNEDIPPTIDAQYIPGFSFTRQPQIRVTKDFGTTLWLAVSLENPQTTSYTSPTAYPASVHLTASAPGGSGFDSANTLSLNHIPDAVMKIAYDPTIASYRLIQHRLSPGVGSRMAAILRREIPSLDADLDAIIRIADEKHAKVVEEFFDALPDGQVKDSAHRIIFGWYAGVVDDSPTAEVLAYEEALMYQPTKDAIALPTYSFNGPDNWTEVDAISLMAGLTLVKNCSPAGVSETLRVVLLKRRTPRRDSSDATAWLSAEAEMPRSFAAARKLL